MAAKPLTKADITTGLQALGLKPGDTVLVHSALSSLGPVEGGAETVLAALLQTVGPQGTVLMPYPLGGAALAKVFSERPDAIKSIHPTHAVAAVGPRAEALVRDHIKSPTACGPDTPFGRLAAGDGRILLLGVDQDRNTMLHAVEELADLPYLSVRAFTYTDRDGAQKEVILRKFPGPHRDFIGLDRLFRETGVMRLGRIGTAVARLMDAGRMVQVALDAVRKNPAAFLCDNPACVDCVLQRGKLKEAVLKKESFTLTAVSDEAGLDTGCLLAVIAGQGMRSVELRRVDGKTIAECDGPELSALADRLKKAQVSVSALDTDVNRGRLFDDPAANRALFKKCLELAAFFETGALVVSSFGVTADEYERVKTEVIGRLTEMARQAGARQVTLLVENEPGTACATWQQCEEIIAAVGSPFLRLAFNPAHFVFTGVKPFLGVPPRIRRLARILYINDGLFSGGFRLPGQGNAELKELISILRCRSFDGCFSLKPPSGGGPEIFIKAAECFWRLLDTM